MPIEWSVTRHFFQHWLSWTKSQEKNVWNGSDRPLVLMHCSCWWHSVFMAVPCFGSQCPSFLLGPESGNEIFCCHHFLTFIVSVLLPEWSTEDEWRKDHKTGPENLINFGDANDLEAESESATCSLTKEIVSLKHLQLHDAGIPIMMMFSTTTKSHSLMLFHFCKLQARQKTFGFSMKWWKRVVAGCWHCERLNFWAVKLARWKAAFQQCDCQWKTTKERRRGWKHCHQCWALEVIWHCAVVEWQVENLNCSFHANDSQHVLVVRHSKTQIDSIIFTKVESNHQRRWLVLDKNGILQDCTSCS